MKKYYYVLLNKLWSLNTDILCVKSIIFAKKQKYIRVKSSANIR